MGNWTKTDLSYLESDRTNNSIKPISYHPQETGLPKINIELSDCFWENCKKVSKYPNLIIFDLEKLPLERFNKIHLLV